MHRLLSALLAAAAFGFCASAAAQATTSSAYISLSGGPSKTSADCTGTTACDNSSTSGRVIVGYRVLPTLAIEASYAYLGKITATVPIDEDSVDASIKGRSIGIGVAALVPFGASKQWTGIARVGVASVRTTVSVSSSSVSGSDSDTKTEPYVGLGLNYALTPMFDVGLAWDNTRINYSGSKATVNSYSVVGSIKF
jgi:hypothetical protein